MTNPTCTYCHHDLDPHQMLLVVEQPVPAGVVVCPQRGCPCTATWCANTSPPTPGLRDRLVELVKQQLAEDIGGRILLQRLEAFTKQRA